MTVAWQPHPGPQTDFCSRWEFEVLYGGAAGGGKLLALDTLLPSIGGWITMGAVQVGDTLFDETGTPCKVTFVSPVVANPKSYRLKFDDGIEMIACADHLWLTYNAKELYALTRLTPEWRANRRARRVSRAKGNKSEKFALSISARNSSRSYDLQSLPTGTIRSTQEIADTLFTLKGRTNHAIPVAGSITTPNANLPIDPYVLGVWLGDGTSASGQVTGIDEEIWQEVEKAGYKMSHSPSCAQTHTILGLSPQLRTHGLIKNKHIPTIYFRASAEQRLSLLQGLMDTDGHAALDGGCEFDNTRRELVAGVYELVVSLGMKATIQEGVAKLNGRIIGPKWRVKFTTSIPVFRLRRKLDRLRPKTRRTTKFRYIVSCDAVDSVPMRCIAVDSPSRLYLASKAMIPTHNTDALIAEALRYVDNPNYNALILRRTFPELQEIIDRTRILYASLGGVYREGAKRWVWPGGGKVSFGHMEHDKDRYKYQGKEFQYIGFDEAGQFTSKQYTYLFSRCRSKDPRIPCRFRAATNPGGEGHHFLKNRFKIGLVAPGQTIYDAETQSSRVFIPAKLSDNPTLIDNDPGYIHRLMMLPMLERMRLLEGIWDAFEGQAFPELNPEVHGVDPFEIPAEWPRYRTMDWGYSTPFSVGWWAVDPNGIIFRYREWYGHKVEAESPNTGLRMSASEVARGVLERERPERERGITVRPGPADPDMWNPRWQNLGGKKMGIVGSSPAEDMAKEGVHFIQADNNRLLGRQSVHKRLELDTEGNPQVYIFKNCLDFWRTMPLLKEFENNPEEVENKGVEDHVYSEFRYFCMFRPTRPVEKPREDIGSFQAERRKLIKARQLASLRGIGLAEAYGKVR